jgi:hypothetical protein
MGKAGVATDQMMDPAAVFGMVCAAFTHLKAFICSVCIVSHVCMVRFDGFHSDIRTSNRFGGKSFPTNQPKWLE